MRIFRRWPTTFPTLRFTAKYTVKYTVQVQVLGIRLFVLTLKVVWLHFLSSRVSSLCLHPILQLRNGKLMIRFHQQDCQLPRPVMLSTFSSISCWHKLLQEVENHTVVESLTPHETWHESSCTTSAVVQKRYKANNGKVGNASYNGINLVVAPTCQDTAILKVSTVCDHDDGAMSRMHRAGLASSRKLWSACLIYTCYDTL